MYSSSKASVFISLVFAAFIGLFSSCSQNTPEIYTTDYSVIFEYNDEKTTPSARLSVFSSSGSDVRRYQRIKITSLENGYCWDTEAISKLEADDIQWAGCANLVMPDEEKLPVGAYEITYYNADEKEYTFKLDLQYDVEIYELLLSALPDFMRKKHGIEKIAVYDKEHILIYYGDRTEEFLTTRDIWNRYSNASTYQIIWYSRNGNVICITPEKPVTPENTEKLGAFAEEESEEQTDIE